jgi:thymidylate synthase
VIVLNVRNPQRALPAALKLIRQRGIERDSRNGKVLVVPEPVTTVYSQPRERVIFHEWRDANPFFHFYESLWMLAGRRDVAPLAKFAKRMETFSDDGKTFNAAYGYRWRHAGFGSPGRLIDGEGPVVFDRDQLNDIVALLRKNPDDRQCVLQIWDHERDLGTQTKDHACNLMATFQIADDALNMVVFCRSNDIVWGCYGANVVHFSMLLEYVAGRVGVNVGTYTQISVNWHGYLDTVEPILEHQSADDHGDDVYDPYEMGDVYPYPIADTTIDEKWDEDVRKFVTNDGRAPHETFHNRFFNEVAMPLVVAHDLFKDGLILEAIDHANRIAADDWRLACKAWLRRRLERQIRRQKAEDDGVHPDA